MTEPQTPQQQPDPRWGPPPRKRRKWPWFLGGIIVLIIIIFAVSSGGGGTPAPAAQQPAAQAPAAGDVITYEVTGAGKASNITYVKDKNMGQEQVASARLPWSKKVTFDNGLMSVQPLSLVAQNGGSGDITCRILRNGEVLTSSTSSGQYAVVTCSAS